MLRKAEAEFCFPVTKAAVLAQRLVGVADVRKDERAAPGERPHGPQQIDGGRRQRHNVLALRLHPRRRQPPQRIAPVEALELVPGRGPHLTRTRRGQRQEAHHDAIEAALAHTVPGVRGRYLRAPFLKRRRELAVEWADLILEGGKDAKDLLLGPRRS
jgi:hypothetical protein